MATSIARGTAERGRRASSPSEPADSNPQNARNAATAASTRAPVGSPAGSRNTPTSNRCPCGAVPDASARTTTAISPRMTSTATASSAISARTAGRRPPAARPPTTNHPASATTTQSTCRPASRNSSVPNSVTPATETHGNTRYVPSITAPVNAPARGPMLPPTKAYTEPADANSADRRTNPTLTSSTSNAARTNASGAARPTSRAVSGPTTAIARVGAITPIDSAAVPHEPRTRRRPGVAGAAVASPIIVRPGLRPAPPPLGRGRRARAARPGGRPPAARSR